MNKTTFLRLKEIEIHDFMGVEYGKIAFSNIDEEYKNGLKANVVGIYGPNGSGKSTLLEALAIACGLNPEGGTANYNFSTYDDYSELGLYISDKLTILHGQSDHLSRRFRSLISERYGR